MIIRMKAMNAPETEPLMNKPLSLELAAVLTGEI